MAKRIGEIRRPILEPLNLIGKVMQFWGPKRFNPVPQYKCNSCERIFEEEARFPYDRFTPTYCPHCGSCNRFETLPFSFDESRQLYKVHLRENTTDFILILLDNDVPPKPGDEIVFPSWAMPKLRGKSPVIHAWTGETTEFSVVGSERSSEVIA